MYARLLFLLLYLLPTTTAHAWTEKVIRVVDGDTIEIIYQGKKEKVRLLNVNTPESVHRVKIKNVPMGKVASQYTKKKLQGKYITLEPGNPTRGKYGRLLAYVFINGSNFNVELVRQGLSPYYVKYGNSKKYDKEFRSAEQLAQKDKLHIWGDSNLTRIYKQKTSKRTQSASESKAKLEALPGMYIGNSKSFKLHRPDCRWGQKISDKNRVVFQSKQDTLNAGYQGCRVCNP